MPVNRAASRVSIVFDRSCSQVVPCLNGRLDCLVNSNELNLPREFAVDTLVKRKNTANTISYAKLRQAPPPALSKTVPTSKMHSQRSLDFSTICTMLLHFDSGIQLKSGDRLFLFHPLSHDSVALSEQSDESSRIIDSSRINETAAKHLQESASIRNEESKPQDPSGPDDLQSNVCNGTTGTDVDQHLESISIFDFLNHYKSCVKEEDSPSPLELVTRLLPRTICKTNSTASSSCEIEKEILPELAEKILESPSHLQKMNMKERQKDGLLSTLLRTVQLQVMMRLQLYGMLGQQDLEALLLAVSQPQKKKKKKRRRQQQGDDSITNQLTQLLELAPFLLPSQTPFVQFLLECIPAELYRIAQDVSQEVFDYFEVSNPYIEESSSSVENAQVSMAAPADEKKPVSSNNVFAGLVKEDEKEEGHKSLTTSKAQSVNQEQAIKTKKNKEDFLSASQKSFSLTACSASNNSLLNKGQGKQVYVASHFNTNMSTLFHQVKVVPKQQPDTLKNSVAFKPPKAKTSATMAGGKAVVSETPLSSLRLKVSETPLVSKSVVKVSETPVVVSKQLVKVSETPVVSKRLKLSETPIWKRVSETPVPKKTTIRFGGINLTKKPTRSLQQQQPKKLTLSPMQRPSARAVAQAALAAAARKKRRVQKVGKV